MAANTPPADNDDSARIELPSPHTTGSVSVEEAIAQRRSMRRYTSTPLSLEEVGQLLWAAQGITDTRRSLRAAPSAGATYPLDTYVVLTNGVFRYMPQRHTLQQISSEDIRAQLAEAALGQAFVAQAPMSIVFVSVPTRTTGRYGTRGIKYIDMEIGHAAQNVHLQAVALGLGSVPVGAFRDEAVSSLLDLSSEQTPLYIIPIGHTP